MSEQNPKLVNSNITDCIPQCGPCPLGCAECFYDGGRFYRSLEPLMPSLEEVQGKVVRVNSGHDSNLQFGLVMEKTTGYLHKFYNTSLPLLRFKAPTVLTINGRDTDRTFYYPTQVKGNLRELMFVRFRVNTWNLKLCDAAVRNWCSLGIPLVLTDMRYYNEKAVKNPEDYQWKKHILNSYYCLKPERLDMILRRYANAPLVFWCGNPFSRSTFCEQCRICELLYYKTKRRMECDTDDVPKAGYENLPPVNRTQERVNDGHTILITRQECENRIKSKDAEEPVIRKVLEIILKEMDHLHVDQLETERPLGVLVSS